MYLEVTNEHYILHVHVRACGLYDNAFESTTNELFTII